jgi:hypothetical protein
VKINKKQHEHDEINKQERHNPTTYRRVDELTMIFSTTEEINTLLIKAVSGYDSAVDLDREANIQGAIFAERMFTAACCNASTDRPS